MVKHNNEIPNNHFHKEWDLRVRTWFNQPMRKKRRRQARIAKAARIAPRPIENLRPIVRCQTNKYNLRERLGFGFSREELKAAGISLKFAKTIGINVDVRRRNKNQEAMDQNVLRLKKYMSNLILFPKNPAKPSKFDTTDKKLLASATQAIGTIQEMDSKPKVTVEVRKITEEDKKSQAYRFIRCERQLKRLDGKRKKRAADEKAAKEEKKK